MVARSPDLVDTVPFVAGDDDGRPRAASYGKFVALDVIGRGGMGVVLRARDPDLDRVVALKLLAPERWRGTADSIGGPELQREGQALAKLSHPNVVTIYEMGRVGDQTFIAMELIEGVTLRAWLRERARPWREILDAFVACGRGLAAAHAAGLVHRDFKPENVLIGRDGRPRVSDFGLVTSGVAADEDAAVGAAGELTVRGAIVGTPAYMAPEQWTGDAVDARTDQFAFCVALWEALGGRRPFGGTSTAALRHAVMTTEPGELPRALPRAVRAIVRRGLARDRAARWPSMDALIERLAAVRRGRRTWWLAAAAGLAAAGAAAIALASRGPDDRCADAAARLDRTWTPAARARVVQAFAASGAAGEAARVPAAIDAYAARWSAIAASACRGAGAAARSSALADQRAICLADRALALDKLVEVLAGADAAIVERSAAAVARLPALDACDDLARLGAITSLPEDPALRRRHAALQVRLAEVEALRLRGDHGAARAAAEAAVADARALAHPPTLATALFHLGEVRRDSRELAAAEAAYRDAAFAAADGHDDVGVARAWTQVLFVASEQRVHLDAAAALDPVADAAIRRAGDPAELRYAYLNASGVLAARREDFATAHARFTAAVALASSNVVWRAEALSNLARVVSQRDGAAAALDLATEAAAAVEEARGPDHPATADALYLVAALTNAVGRPAEAGPRFARAKAIHARVFGPDSVHVVDDLVGLGNVASRLRDYGAARAHFEEAIAIERRVDAPPAQRAMTLAALAGMLGDSAPAESLPYYQEAIALLAATAGPASVDYLGMSMSHAQALKTLDRCDEAASILARIDAPLAPYPYLHADALLVAAQCDRGGGRARSAIATLERALGLCGAEVCDPSTRISLQWELGTLLAETGRDRPRGRALVEAARAAMVALDPDDPMIAASDDWLRPRRR